MKLNQMSLLVIRCPFKPFSGLNTKPLNQESLSEQTEEFTWHFSNGIDSKGQFGNGSVESMPYADQALVLISTLDVRLIEVKIPLVSDKKLHLILPGLMEEYLLQEVDHVYMQVLPPLPESPALQRTVAVIDRVWFSWLNLQLKGLLSPHVQMVPDCYLLKQIQSNEDKLNNLVGYQPSIAYELRGQDLVWTIRSSDQIGASWVERVTKSDCNTKELIAHLPSHLRTEQVMSLDWDWLLQSAHQLMGQAHHTRINLLPSTFRSKSRSGKARNSNEDSRFASVGTWTNTGIWRSSTRWLGYCFASFIIGSGLHLSWLALSDWRWNQQMQLWAIPYLPPGSAVTFAENQGHQNILTTITKNAIQNKRMHGLVSNADFSQMTSELQRLNALYGGGIIESLKYDGYSLSFELKPEALERNKVSPTEFISKTHTLGLGVIALGGNRFQLLPYADLGGSL